LRYCELWLCRLTATPTHVHVFNEVILMHALTKRPEDGACLLGIIGKWLERASAPRCSHVTD
jgi:hypothetical protein